MTYSRWNFAARSDRLVSMNKFDEILDFLGEKIRELRREKELSQEKFAFQCNLDRTYISDVERGKRNISIINLRNIADALDVPLSKLFEDFSSTELPNTDKDLLSYKIRADFSTFCGFTVTSNDIAYAAVMTSNQLQALPFTLFQSIDLKALSGIVGAFFGGHLSKRVGAILNPIEKGHPDIIPRSGQNASEMQLRNYPDGLEIKSTVGNVKKGSNLQTGEKRLSVLTGLTWQAHHQEVKRLLGLVIDFGGQIYGGRHFPIITAAFYADNLETENWGQISGTTGRNTKVTGLRASGKRKMGAGWTVILDKQEYQQKYENLLSFQVEDGNN